MSYFFIEKAEKNSWKILSNDINRGPVESNESTKFPWKLRRIRIKAEVSVWDVGQIWDRFRGEIGQNLVFGCQEKDFQIPDLDYLSGRCHHFVRWETWEEEQV